MAQDNTNENQSPLSADEIELIAYYRLCSPRRKDVVKRFAAKLADLEGPVTPQVISSITNILYFRRRKDD